MNYIEILTSMQAAIEDLAKLLKAKSHEFVDLGLPSGLKWATCNVGATKPEEYGDYFAWGETETKSNFTWSTYSKFNPSGDGTTFTKYTFDGTTVLEAIDDAATANWGGSWRMPTDGEWAELFNNCTSILTTQNGVSGFLLSATNGKKIFLPAAGYMENTSLEEDGTCGYYWSSSLYLGSANDCAKMVVSDEVDRFGSRLFGISVRPVSN